jgi:hypothetical protein
MQADGAQTTRQTTENWRLLTECWSKSRSSPRTFGPPYIGDHFRKIKRQCRGKSQIFAHELRAHRPFLETVQSSFLVDPIHHHYLIFVKLYNWKLHHNSNFHLHCDCPIWTSLCSFIQIQYYSLLLLNPFLYTLHPFKSLSHLDRRFSRNVPVVRNLASLQIFLHSVVRCSSSERSIRYRTAIRGIDRPRRYRSREYIQILSIYSSEEEISLIVVSTNSQRDLRNTSTSTQTAFWRRS